MPKQISNSPDIDETDVLIVDALQRNAAQRIEDIAKIVKLAPSSVHDRIRRLERNGVIRRWTVDIDPSQMGLGVLAFIGVRASKPCTQLLENLLSVRAIEECHSVAGQLSMILKVRVANTGELLEVVDRLRQIPGIDGTDSTIVLQTHIERPPATAVKRLK
jgi:DNA-binding Lrp family transcriptional regulator